MTQRNLFNLPLNGEVVGQTIRERFESFHKLNPHVFTALRHLALEAINAGRKQYGIAGLFEIMRWNYMIETHGDEFKLNNDYRALYARKLMVDVPELSGFFKIRTRPSVVGNRRGSDGV